MTLHRSILHSAPALAGLLLAFALASPAAAQIAPATEPIPSLADAVNPEARAFIVDLEFFGQNEVATHGVDVIDSVAPARFGTGPYRVEIVNGEGDEIESFDWANPQEMHFYDTAGGQHSVVTLASQRSSLIFPFSPRAVELRLVDKQLGWTVASVDLETPAHDYCAAHPWEPRCREINPPGEEPNLVPTVFGPFTAARSGDVAVSVRVANLGGSDALGTHDDPDGYMVDLVLSSDDQVPATFATYSPNFTEDVLLGGGRVSNTETLPPGESFLYETTVTLPDGIVPGRYCLGAVVDPGQTVHEDVEPDNVTCFWWTLGEGD